MITFPQAILRILPIDRIVVLLLLLLLLCRHVKALVEIDGPFPQQQRTLVVAPQTPKVGKRKKGKKKSEKGILAVIFRKKKTEAALALL
jgi:hypothetical protein